MVSGKGEYARSVNSQEWLPVNKPEVVSTRAILKITHGKSRSRAI